MTSSLLPEGILCKDPPVDKKIILGKIPAVEFAQLLLSLEMCDVTGGTCGWTE